MAEVDTSSYPKPGQNSFLDNFKNYQQIDSNALTIQKQHLDLANQGYEYLIRELNSLGPNPTHDQMLNVGQQAVKNGLVKPEMYATFATNVPTDPAQIGAYRDQIATKLADTNSAIQYHYGQNGYQNNGQQTTPTKQFLRGGPVASGLPIQNQPAPTTEVVGPTGQKSLLGAQGSQTPDGTGQATNIPGQFAPNNRLGNAVQPPTVQQPRGPATGMSPMWETGQKQYVADQNEGSQTFTRLRPLLQAIPLAKQLTTGPTTDTINNVAATLKNLGIIDVKDNDPTAMYQELNKKLEQYVSQHGSRSDSDLAHTYASNPNAKTQIQPALVKLAQDQVALDRINAVRSLAFQDNDFSKYGQHRVTFPANMDPRAFSLDTLEPTDRSKLVHSMGDILKNDKSSTAEKNAAVRFFKSLTIAKKYIPEYQEMNGQQ